jgi:hypothetical protein
MLTTRRPRRNGVAALYWLHRQVFTPAMADAACTWDSESFTARAHYTGENRIVIVEGKGCCPTSGWTHELEEDNPGINPDPTALVVRIRTTPPEEAAADVLTDVTVQGFFESEQSVDHVVIRALDHDLRVQEPA